MPYMRFAAGDPGFFSFLGRVGKAVAGFLPGGGAITRTGEALAKVARHSTGLTKAGQMGHAAIGAIRRHPGRAAVGAVGIAALPIALGHGMPSAGGGASAGRMRGAGGGGRRRMHVTNVKALRRAIRRATGFARLARKVLRFTSPRPPKGRMYFKHPRRKSASARM
jgi:hypothetical protein